MAKNSEPMKPYQIKAVNKILEKGGRGLIIHPMGSGKTRTSIEAVEALRDQGKAGVTIAVVPASLRTNYLENGVKQWSDKKGTILGSVSEDSPDIYSEKIPKSDYYIVSYDMFKKDPQLYISRTKADTLVVDEMHNFRNDTTKNYQEMRAISPKVKNFIGMTGSVFNNSPDDIRPLVDIVSNGKHDLGKSKSEFAHRYTIKRGEDTVLINKPRLQNAMNEWVDYTNLDKVQAETNVPKKSVATIDVEMSPEQQEYYDFVMKKVPKDVRDKIRDGLPVNRKEAFHILPMLIQARCVSNSVGYLNNSLTDEESAFQTPKLRQALTDIAQHMKENPKAQIIVHSHLVEAGTNPISAALTKAKIRHGVITGKSTKEKRDAAVNDYNKGKNKVIVLSSAGTTGLNLPDTTMHIALDGHYNPAVIAQIEARGVRQNGQSYIEDPEKRKVLIRRYRSVIQPSILARWGIVQKPKSVDEWIYSLANNKNEVNNQAERLLKVSSDAPTPLECEVVLSASAEWLNSALDKVASTEIIGVNTTVKGHMPDNMLNYSEDRQKEISRNMTGKGYSRDKNHVLLRYKVEATLESEAKKILGADNVKVQHPLYFSVGSKYGDKKDGFIARTIDPKLLSKATFIPGDSFKHVVKSRREVDVAGIKDEVMGLKELKKEIGKLKDTHPALQDGKKNNYIEGHLWVPWKVDGKKIVEDK